MKKSNHLANPFSAFSGHRLFHVIAGTLVGVMAVTQASAMLPTPEQAIDTSVAVQSNSNQASTNSGNSTVQAVNSKITASLISVDANGQEVLVPVNANTRLQSGNVLEYQGYFTNTNADRVRKMTVTMSIPEQVELLRAVSPDFPYGSTDGNTFARMPLRGKVDNQLQEIPLKYYKSVRWDIEGVGLNDTVAVKYRARVK
ncbi:MULTISPECIES: hypothetical protein [Psychrobacter]|uniref:hypothetical protein n=1 Tax=Psychrobacter TaxID=497 RepID=UPI00042A84C5|nr:MULTISPECIES: hypothetical protein [Psychrobacter]NRD71424.1 hypothetical protein [Psychrobacter okhotskensis]PKG36525.1 hypothetical protein CXF65_02010 [Psychrobacter sp. Sarcosine-3u-12]